MPKKFDEILVAVKRNNKGKTNPRTNKPYTESELYAIAQAQYQAWKKKHKGIQIITQINKSWEDEVEIVKGAGKTKQRFVEVIVSGLESDRESEKMSQEAIDDMITQYKSGTIPFFSDHGLNPHTGDIGIYTWKGIMGVWVDAFQEGSHLKAKLRLNKSHPDHELFWNYVQEDMPIGFSVGANPVDSPQEVFE